MESDADKLRAELQRFKNLRVWASDKKTREALTEYIKQADARLHELENAARGREASKHS
jgi:hypothetical protein